MVKRSPERKPSTTRRICEVLVATGCAQRVSFSFSFFPSFSPLSSCMYLAMLFVEIGAIMAFEEIEICCDRTQLGNTEQYVYNFRMWRGCTFHEEADGPPAHDI